MNTNAFIGYNTPVPNYGNGTLASVQMVKNLTVLLDNISPNILTNGTVIRYDVSTNISNNYDLVTKIYVDSSIPDTSLFLKTN